MKKRNGNKTPSLKFNIMDIMDIIVYIINKYEV